MHSAEEHRRACLRKLSQQNQLNATLSPLLAASSYLQKNRSCWGAGSGAENPAGWHRREAKCTVYLFIFFLDRLQANECLHNVGPSDSKKSSSLLQVEALSKGTMRPHPQKKRQFCDTKGAGGGGFLFGPVSVLASEKRKRAGSFFFTDIIVLLAWHLTSTIERPRDESASSR